MPKKKTTKKEDTKATKKDAMPFKFPPKKKK